jgi:hypothetical protein
VNISTRSRVQRGDNVMIAGFIVTGGAPKRVIIRAIGPSLRAGDAPVEGRMEDPVLELFDQNGQSISVNDNWKDSPDRGDIQSSGVAPEDDRESAITRVLADGPYTAVMRGRDDSTGIGLVEVYDRTQGNNNAELANISTRAFVEAGDNVLIGGFIVGDQPAGARVLMRAIGPSLKSDLPNALENPVIDLYDRNGMLLTSNDNWKESPRRGEIEQSGAAPRDDAESAIVIDLTPAPYTAVVRGVNDTTGVALVEAFNLR